MAFFDSFAHGEALTEILLEGHNPDAGLKLATADVDALRQQLMTSERLQAFVIGRIVGAGRGVWALTDQSVVLRDAARSAVHRLARAQLVGFEATLGRYGYTVRLQTAARAWSLFGVDRERARQMHESLEAGGTPSQWDDRPLRAVAWRDAQAPGWAQDCLEDARKRLALA